MSTQKIRVCERIYFISDNTRTQGARWRFVGTNLKRSTAKIDKHPCCQWGSESPGPMWSVSAFGELVLSLALPKTKTVLLKWNIRTESPPFKPVNHRTYNATYRVSVNKTLGEDRRQEDGGREYTPYTECSWDISQYVKPGANEVVLAVTGGEGGALLCINEISVDIEQPDDLETADPTSKVISVDGIEVTQSIQDMTHRARLIKNKKTFARVYVTPPSAWDSGNFLSGEISIYNTGTGETFYAFSECASDAVEVRNAKLLEKRKDTTKSLNFMLPDRCLDGNYEIRLNECYTSHRDGGCVQRLMIQPHAARAVSITEKAPPMRLRVIGLRYTDADNKAAQPRQVDYDLIKSWLTRAFPVPSVEFSIMVTDAEHSFFLPLGAKVDEAIVQVAAIRNLDMAYSNIDRRTHYYGLVLDQRVWVNQQEKKVNKTFMRGKAETLPPAADPTTIAAGPAGTPVGKLEDSGSEYRDFASWDKDDSYGDWYAAHEIGHTLGRCHVNATGSEVEVDANYPYQGGKIGDANNQFMGFDVGDNKFNISPQALPYTVWTDVMSYGENEWLSDYTYQGILTRLQEEDRLGADGMGYGCAVRFEKPESGYIFVNVIVAKDLSGASGATQDDEALEEYDVSGTGGATESSDRTTENYRFEYVNPVPGGFVPIAVPTGTAKFRVWFENKSSPKKPSLRSEEYPVRKRGDFIDSILKLRRNKNEEITKIEFLDGDKVEGTYTVPELASEIKNLKATPPTTDGIVTLTWDSKGGSPVFNVQVTPDGNLSNNWVTVVAGLTEKTFNLVVSQFENLNKYRVRVMATNGITAKFSNIIALPPQ